MKEMLVTRAVDMSAFSKIDPPMSVLYSGPEGEELVQMIASDVSRRQYKQNVVIIRRDNGIEIIVPEGYINPINTRVEFDNEPGDVSEAQSEYRREINAQSHDFHPEECGPCDDCYADLSKIDAGPDHDGDCDQLDYWR